MQFLILILSLFYGTSVCSEEVESKTLTYLITRPLPKSAIITGKYAAYTFLVLSLTAIGLVSSFLVLNLSRLGDFQLFLLMMRYLGVLALGILCYTAFFTFLGTFLKKSVLAGLLFAFGWENVIQYFPGSTQRFAIVHYLKSLLPSMKSGKWSFLTFRLDPTPPGPAIVILLLIAAGFLGLACLVFVWKEYGFED
jgi:ABC-type transport system involved in multi-copper enzyme maturation permease subunit